MRYLVVLLLAGCAQTMTLFPQGGGQPITGTLMTAEKTMKVTIDGEAYSGDFINASAPTFGTIQTFGKKPTTSTFVGSPGSKQFSALLVSPGGKTLRCEFVGGLMETGNGTCVTGEGRGFDLLLKP